MGYQTIGKLDRRIVIKSPIKTEGIGGEILEESFSTIATVWARYESIPGGESFVDDQRRNKEKAKFSIRDRKGLTTEMVIQYDGRDWDIQSISPVTRNRELDIVAEVIDYSPGA